MKTTSVSYSPACTLVGYRRLSEIPETAQVEPPSPPPEVRPMRDRLVSLSRKAVEDTAFPHEVIPRGTVSHENYEKFMRGVHGTLAPVLRGSPEYAALLDCLETTGDRVSRKMANNEQGKLATRFPGARDPYRLAVTPGQHMTRVADELKNLSGKAAQCKPGSSKDATRAAAERELLKEVSFFLNEMKRSVRSASVVPVCADYSGEQARRFGAISLDGMDHPGQEHSHTKGAYVYGGGGVSIKAIECTVQGGPGVSKTHRVLKDNDLDCNYFEETAYTPINLELGAKLSSALKLGFKGNAGWVPNGRYYEGPDPQQIFNARNLDHSRRPRFVMLSSAGEVRRKFDETRHGLGQLGRKLVGGGSPASLYDKGSWISPQKEEKGKYNHRVLQTSAARIEQLAGQLAALKGAASPAAGLAQAAREAFPSGADRIDRALEGFAQQAASAPSPPVTEKLAAAARELKQPDEPMSIPAMPPKPGAPREKKGYTAVMASTGVTLTLGIHPLVDQYGPEGLKSRLAKLSRLLPSMVLGSSYSFLWRSLLAQRQLPVHEALSPSTVRDFAKGIERVDRTANEVTKTLWARSGLSMKEQPRSAHPATAVLDRFEYPAWKKLRNAPAVYAPSYQADIQDLLRQGRLSAPDLLESASERLDAMPEEYLMFARDAHEAKEAHRSGDKKLLAQVLDRMNQRIWNGLHPIDHHCSLEKLEHFIGHGMAFHTLAYARLKYEITLAKQSLAAHTEGCSAQERERLQALGLGVDERVQVVDNLFRCVDLPLTVNARSGYDFYNHETEATRQSHTHTHTFSVSAGLPATLGSFTKDASLPFRGPDVVTTATQAFAHVEKHPNPVRTGDYYTLNISLKSGFGMRTVLMACDDAVNNAVSKKQIPAEFAAAVRGKLHRDMSSMLRSHGEALAALSRSCAIQFEIAYGSPPKLGKEKPLPFLRYIKVAAQTTYDNSMRSPDLLAGMGHGFVLVVGETDTTNTATVMRYLNGNSVRHLMLEYGGATGLKNLGLVFKENGDIDFKATNETMRLDDRRIMRGAWFHGQCPLIDVVEGYLKHAARTEQPGAPVDPHDEFQYIDLDSPLIRRIERDERHLKHFAAGSKSDPYSTERESSSREILRRQAAGWVLPPERPDGKSRFTELRERVAKMSSDEERLDFFTRDPEGKQLLTYATAVFNGYQPWVSTLLAATGYYGETNKVSLDLLKVKGPESRHSSLPAHRFGVPAVPSFFKRSASAP